MLNKLKFKSGERPGQQPLSVDLTPVTVFVGPNNSGKSQALREIAQYCTSGTVAPDFKVVADCEFSGRNREAVEVAYKGLDVEAAPADGADEHIFVRYGQNRGPRIRKQSYLSALENPTANKALYAEHYARHRMLKLDGVHRLQLVGNQGAGNLAGPVTSPLQGVWRDNDKRREWREIVYRAFKFYPVIDPLNTGNLTIKTSTHEPTEDEERTWKGEAIEFHKNTIPIETYSDGVKAFVGIMLQLIAGAPELILIDEPEAFLHPSLCFLLGREITKLLSPKTATKSDGSDSNPKSVVRTNAQLIVSTHSPEFLMGCLQAKAKTNIVRVTYDAPVATARLLQHDKLLELMRKPVLRSAKALSGLFYNSVVVTEADADRAFYQEINERLIELKPEWGIESCLFLNANGKDAVPDIVKPLRDVGISAAMIVDIDVLKEGGTNWAKFLDACKIPPLDKPSFETARSNVLAALQKSSSDFKRQGGINVLNGSDLEAAQNLLSRLAEYGLFVVPGGEVENWLPTLAVSRNKYTWLREIFEKLGDDPARADFVRPTDGDVWEFLSRVKTWLTTPTHKGV